MIKWLLLLVCVAEFALLIANAPARAERPNILVIVADDLGWADVGYHGSPFPTPNIDRLACAGVELDQHYVAPMCTPTRAALLSGRYWSRFGNTSPSNTQVFPFGTVTLASALSSVGYETCIAGKWHLGSLPKWGPRKFGFQRSCGSLAGGVGPWNHRYKRGDYTKTWHRNDKLIDEEGHVTDLITSEAVRFIQAKRDGPFFLYVPFTAVHHPLDEPKKWLEKGRTADPTRPQYAACAMHMDDGIGKMVSALEASGQRMNTLILFFSDNGGTIDAADGDSERYPGEYPTGEALGLNNPLRGRKTQLYEGGIRTPAVANWPGHLRARKVTTPIHVIDWMPTLCKLVGYTPTNDLKWDGQNIWPMLTGENKSSPARLMYWQGVGRRTAALRQGKWKLIVHGANLSGRRELFNLGEDPDEKNDVVNEHKEIAEKLEQLLRAQMKRDNDAVVAQ